MVIAEKWFSDINLTGGELFPLDLIKHEKLRLNIKIYVLHETKQRMRTIEMDNGCNKQVVQILHEEHNGKFIFKVNIIIRIPKPVELPHEWVLKKFKYQETALYAILFL